MKEKSDRQITIAREFLASSREDLLACAETINVDRLDELKALARRVRLAEEFLAITSKIKPVKIEL